MPNVIVYLFLKKTACKLLSLLSRNATSPHPKIILEIMVTGT